MSCMYCDKDNEKRKEILIEVGHLSCSTLFILKNQNHLGRVVVAFDGHCKEVFDIPEEQRAGFFNDIARVAKAMDEIYHPDKINYGMFGDTVPHIHMHIVPKYKDQLQWGHFFWDKGNPEVALTEEEYAKMAEAYKIALNI